MKGSCLCGAVRFETPDTVNKNSSCHCTQCRKQSGHAWASADVAASDVTIEGEVRWYESSDWARRGFCPICGSFLFWKVKDKDEIAFALGAIDGPTGLKLERHIFTADKGDYYEIADGLPQKP